MTPEALAAGRTNKKKIKVNAMSQAQLIKLLLEGTYTCRELAHESGLHYMTVLDYTRELHRVGAVHICMWEKDNRGRDASKIFKLGPGKDAKREKLPATERSRRYREKLRQISVLNCFTDLIAA